MIHVGVGQLYCEGSIIENTSYRDHIQDTVHVDRHSAPPLYAAAPPPPSSSTSFSSASRPDVSSSTKASAPASSQFAAATPSDANPSVNHNVFVPSDREHLSWNEFQAMNKGVPRERIQEVWKSTPWYKNPSSERVSWNDFQRILKGKVKQVLLHSRLRNACILTSICYRTFGICGMNTAMAAT
jgi:hypothetical protein